MDFPIQDHADVKKTVLLDLEIGGKGVLMPAEQNARCNGLDIHRRSLQDAAVLGGILDHFLVEHLILTPAGHGVKLVKMVRKRRNMEIAADEVRGVAVLLAGLEIAADHELKKPDRVVGHGENINECSMSMQAQNLRSRRNGQSPTENLYVARRALPLRENALKNAPENHKIRSTSRGVLAGPISALSNDL